MPATSNPGTSRSFTEAAISSPLYSRIRVREEAALRLGQIDIRRGFKGRVNIEKVNLNLIGATVSPRHRNPVLVVAP
jgi:hypothetical protein